MVNKVYLVTGDADIEDVEDCPRECLALDDILKTLRESLDRPVREKVGADRATVFLVVFDCCRCQLDRSFGDALACEPAPESAPLKNKLILVGLKQLATAHAEGAVRFCKHSSLKSTASLPRV